ncbi:hypothetical protein [Ramlibacter sp.]|uniref:hypothetical protein n=1 Tax=Ramlibacter sp. TaxID=1917967 RepID=UPI0017BE66F2|nr:hypothetical protein [Ramlibacter sp.]MBA2673007.1 hypothetical protein [Ramlibacter sp.]
MKLLSSALVALMALCATGLAQARSNVYWSVGVNAAPGVTLGVGNMGPVYAQPVYVAPQPVYVAQPQVYYRPAPVYYSAAPVYYNPAPVYYNAVPVYYGPRGHWKHRKHSHWHH